MASAGYGNVPVLVSDAMEYLLIAHDASAEWASQFVSLDDAPVAVRYMQNDLANNEFPIPASCAPLHGYDFKVFEEQYPAFLLYSNCAAMGSDWWPRRLCDDGYALRPVAIKPRAEHDFYHLVYLMTRTSAADLIRWSTRFGVCSSIVISNIGIDRHGRGQIGMKEFADNEDANFGANS